MNQKVINLVHSNRGLIGKESILTDSKGNIQGRTVYIHEVAGRDSFAALKEILKKISAEEAFVVLSLAVAPTEYGDVDTIGNTFNIFEKLLQKEKIQYALSVTRDNSLWAALCGRNVSESFEKYGFYTPCISCHAYFHILRAFIALDIGARFIISGERVNHSGKIKINQTEKVLKAYEEILKPFGIEILHPVKDIEEEKELSELIGMDWEEEKNQMKCVFSGNYLTEEGESLIAEVELDNYLQDFLIPAGKKAINLYMGSGLEL